MNDNDDNQQQQQRKQQQTQTLACNPFTRQEFYTTDLSVVYQVETATPLFLDSDSTTTTDKNQVAAVTVLLQALVQGAAVESIHDTLCGSGGAMGGGGGGEGLDASSSSGSSSTTEQETSISTEVPLSQCLYSITAAETHEILYCHDDHDPDDTTTTTTTTTRSNYCIAFAGNVKLFHASECAQENVQLAAWLALAHGTQQDAFLQSIRNGQRQWNSEMTTTTTTTTTMTELNVTRVQVTENLYPRRSTPHGDDSTTTTPNDNMAVVSTHPGKISPGGYVAIALAGMLLCVLLGILWMQHRQQHERRGDNNKKNRSLEETSAATQNSYQTADFSNLALQHSRNDVHMCASNARCAICVSQQPEDKVVQMIPVPKNQTPLYEQQQQHQHDDSLATSYLDFCYSGDDDIEDDDSDDDNDETYAGDEEEGVEAIAQPEVPVEIYSQKRRNHRIPNIFAKKTKPPAVALESVSFVRVASAQRATNKYHHHHHHRCEEMSCSVEL